MVLGNEFYFVCVYFYGKGVGDIYIKAECNLLIQTCEVQDYVLYDDATTDKTSEHFDSSIALRNNGASSITFDSNGYYVVAPTVNGSQSLIPISALNNNSNGLEIELDYYPLNSDSNMGINVYQNNNNWGGIKSDNTKLWYYKKVNGSYAEAYTTDISSFANSWVHCKFIVSSTSLTCQVYNANNVKLLEKTYDIPSNHIKIGLEASWSSSARGRFKNLKVKPL